MTDTQIYPACLRRPNAGGHVQSRVPKTEKAYRIRFAGMIRTLCTRKRWLEADAHDLAIAIGEHAGQYTKNTLKQYHAAIRQNLRDRWLAGAIGLDEIGYIDKLLQAHQPAPANRKASMARTSARRAKSVQPEQIAAMSSALLSKPTPIRQLAAAMLDYGVELATRPGEFLTIGPDPTGRFWVRSAKFSLENGRGLQSARIVPTDNFPGFKVAELHKVSKLVAAERAQGATFRKLLRRCQHAIREARAAVGGRSRRLTAYTVRHQARANYVAMGMTAAEIAVLMGHASAGTAQSHYAPGRQAWRGSDDCPPPSIDPALVARVRPIHHSRGWNPALAGAAPPRP